MGRHAECRELFSSRRMASCLLAACLSLAVPAVLSALTPGWVQAQPSQSPEAPQWQADAGGRMAFDVASVKPDKSNDPPVSSFPLGPGDAFAASGGLFRATNFPLIAYLRFALKLGQGDLPGLPAWVSSERFDIEARAPGNPSKDQMRLMMQALLADRFKLAMHHEIRQGPVFALVLLKQGKNGPQLQPGTENCSPAYVPNAAPQASASAPFPVSAMQCGIGPIPAATPSHLRIGGRNITMATLAGFLKNPYTGVERPVIDRTNLKGTFDFSVEWADPSNASSDANSQAEPAGSTFLEALQEQLGLKLVPRTGPVDAIVVDHVERPSLN